MLSTAPVMRLSIATTSSPRSSNASQRCEPRKPAPPVTTALAMVSAGYEPRPRSPGVASTGSAADADVGEPPPLERRPVEEVTGVDDPRRLHEARDLVEVEPAEVVPLGEDRQNPGSVAHRVGIVSRHHAAHRALDGGVVRLDLGPLVRQERHDPQRRRLPGVVGAGLEGEAPHRDLDAVEGPTRYLPHLGRHALELVLVDADDAAHEVERVPGAVGDLHERTRVLRQAAAPEPGPGLEELVPDARVVAHPEDDVLDVGAHRVADGGD